MTDEEVIARDLGDVAGETFLYWDRVIRGLDAASPLPSRRLVDLVEDSHATSARAIARAERILSGESDAEIARAIIDRYLNEHPQFPR